jgi:hypothetical protein
MSNLLPIAVRIKRFHLDLQERIVLVSTRYGFDVHPRDRALNRHAIGEAASIKFISAPATLP